MKTRAIHKILLTTPFLYSGKNRNVGIDPVVTRHSGQEIKTGMTFPLGVAYMGAVLRQAGYEVRILDPIAEPMPATRITEAAVWADAIAIPFSPYHQDDTVRFFRECPEKVRILTGQVARHFDRQFLEQDVADIIIEGEPEETIVEICRQWPTLDAVPGCVYRGEDGKVRRSAARGLVPDLDALPLPLRDFADPRLYWDITFWGEPTAFVLPSRGCSFGCTFCAQNALNGRRVRLRSPIRIVDEIETIVREQHITNIMFFDEIFTIRNDWVVQLCEELLRRRLRIEWACGTRADLLREDTVRLMKKAGCVQIQLGLESANDEILKALGKNLTVARVREAVEMLQRVKMPFTLFCIFGSPGESAGTIRRTLDFIRWAKPLFVSFNSLTALPGSMLFTQVKDQLDLQRSLRDMDILHTKPMFCDYTAAELSAIIRSAYMGFYLRTGFLGRALADILRRPRNPLVVGRALALQAAYFYRSIIKGLRVGKVDPVAPAGIKAEAVALPDGATPG